MLTSILIGAGTTLAGIIVRLLWNRKIGRHLRAKWHRRWLARCGVTVGKTMLRMPTPSGFELWNVEDVDGSDMLLRNLSSPGHERTTFRWYPIARLRKEGIDTVEVTGEDDGR